MELLPLWFLLLSLALPRISLVLGYFVSDISFITNLHGLLPVVLGALVPRVLVIIIIFLDRGMSLWLIVHAMVMCSVYLSLGAASNQR